MLAAALLGGCISSAPQQATSSQAPAWNIAWQQHQLTVSALQNWRIRSKFGYVTNHDSGSAWLDWEQSGDDANANISGPFGVGAAQVISSTQGATLKQAGEPDLHATSADELTHHLFGWPFPIEQLRYWVRGLPAPDVRINSLTTEPSGLLSHLEQDGWVLAFTRYQNTAVGPLPGKIEASTGDLRIKLLIKEWFVAPDAPGISTPHALRDEH
ncbi:MAG: outer membrane lipoprotein LolB [Porticoccaceae bacterium]|nr:outer membrane lipoprotein LolB [Porticoccaceae bacterium]